ncbi:hypothetical protein FACS1894167_09310 [Synergistales bacterium]|nr:hypothetical protein FACS1894167_09310 [Synergistales bacterium]
MKLFRNISLGLKFMLSSLVIVALFGTICWRSIETIHNCHAACRMLIYGTMTSKSLLQEAHSDCLSLNLQAERFVYYSMKGDGKNASEAGAAFQSKALRLNTNLGVIQTELKNDKLVDSAVLSEVSGRITDAAEILNKRYLPVAAKIQSAGGNIDADDWETLGEYSYVIAETLNEAYSAISSAGTSIYSSYEDFLMDEINKLEMFDIISVALSLALTGLISLRLRKPVRDAKEAMRVVAGGNFIDIRSPYRDEIASLRNSAADIIDNFKNIINEIRENAVSLGEGDISSRIDESRFRGDYAEVIRAVNGTMDVIAGLRDSNRRLDITNRELEEAVKERTSELEEQTRIAVSANAAKSAFLAKMSHEIRTPMNAITGISELILREKVSPAVHEYATDVKHASANLLSIINDILDFSKIESGKMEIASAEYLFASLINDVISIIRMRLAEKPVIFVVNVDGALPNVMVGDEVRIRQILLNLLSNAVKYTNTGWISLKINGERSVSDEIKLAFEIADTGIGLKKEDMGKLFGDFVQFDTQKNKYIEGTGLGLAITRKLCLAMGGDVTVSSSYGDGSTFTAVISQKVRDSTPLAAVEEPETKKVLLYKTNEVYTKSISRSLENLGVNYGIVTNDEDLLKAVEGGEYNYIFVNFIIFDRVQRILNDAGYRGNVAMFSEFGNATLNKGARAVALPAHSISIANILNDAEEIRGYRENEGAIVRFTAPSAQVLLADDIATNLKVAEGLLAPYNTRIFTCMSGAEAVRLVQESRCDMLFIDHLMPEMDGVETTAAIRALEGEYFKDVPIIALTANAVSGMKEMFLASGFNDYLAKPIEISKLNEIMEKWIPEGKRLKAAVTGSNASEPAAAFIEIDGLDTAKGIIMTGGTPEGYIDVLKSYCRDVDARLEFLHSFAGQSGTPADAEMSLFITQVHALKSASASIGAAEISKTAAELERAGQDRDMKMIQSLLGAFCDDISSLSDRIGRALPDDKPSEAAAEAVTPLDKDSLLRLREALASEDVRSIDAALEELSGASDEATSKALSAIADCVLLADFDMAIGEIETLLSVMSAGAKNEE